MSELYHYKSKYYDPEKAHEYYELHKKLKGRDKKNTDDLTSEGKSIARQVRSNILKEQRAVIEAGRQRTKAEIKEHVHKSQLEAAKLKMVIQSGALKNDLNARSEAKAKLRKLIDDNKKKRKELLDKFKSDTEALTKEYEKKYENELDELRKEYKVQETTSIPRSSLVNKSTQIEQAPTVTTTVSNTSRGSNDTATTTASNHSVYTNNAQTSIWAKQREKRRAKKLKHSDELSDEINSIINGDQTMDEVIEKNKESDNRIADLDEFIQSL